MNERAIIDSFSREYRFLSNFYPSPIEIDGIEFPTVEHAYQAWKCLFKKDARKIAQAKTPGEAKKLGRQIKHTKANWHEKKIQAMAKLVLQKFKTHSDLKDKLLATGNAKLVEGNTWNDFFWGVCGGQGDNWLGKILMNVRQRLKQEQEQHG